MPRILVIDKTTKNLAGLKTVLLNANLDNAQAASAIESLQALNPGLDLDKLTAGTAVLVPDLPAFNASSSASASGAPLDDLQKLVTQALDGVAADLKAGNATRAAERADVVATMKTDAVRRILAGDADLKQLAADATKALTEEQQQADQAEQSLAAASAAALAKLKEISKLLT
jgi:hypothetical protein